MSARPAERSYRLKVSITGCCLPILQSLHTRYGGNIHEQGRSVNKQLYQWEVGKLQECATFLRDIQSLVIEKRSQVDVAVKWLDHRLMVPVRKGKGSVSYDLDLAKRTHDALRALKQVSY